MAKKQFNKAPKPGQSVPDEAIEAFEKGGVGKDTKKLRVANSNKDEATKRLSVDLNPSTHLRFKTACTATGRKMVQEIEAFILERTSQLEKEAGISHK